ncbi:tyrosine-type recombinase/integrase [Bacillus weihaiensis]|uniref:tyrosine-type recombinase/integrase n=1 Tax=Bacillus weihaiensis TaxID=1547283 RepID=UPI002357893C|nr:tyrosine-type recombinase/integrase [Bacillus weihaiensis]
MEEIIKQFIHYLQKKDREESTVKMYVQEIRHFIGWMESNNKQLASLTEADIIQFRNFLIQKNMKPATINKSLSTISSFLKWVKETYHYDLHFPVQIRLSNQTSEQKPTWITQAEQSELLHILTLEKNPFQKARNEAIVYLMLFTGLRIEEVSQLLIKQVHNDYLFIQHGENIDRKVPILRNLSRKLTEWLEIRNRINKQVYHESPYLFVTKRSGKMQPRAIQYVIDGYNTELSFSVTSQILRHTFCRRLVEQGYTVEQVKELAGHKSIVTSYKYF